jgi:hypothetical protein
MSQPIRSTPEVVLEDAIDMHCHFGPEPMLKKLAGAVHKVTPVQAATEARELGMRALVLKAHEFPSVGIAHLVNDAVPEIKSFGGICCDFMVGGLNVGAVEVALDNGAKVVWLPTVSAANDALLRPPELMPPGDLYRVIDEEGNLIPDALAIMDLVREYDAVLATGHISRDETFKVAEAFASRGHLVITHAMSQTTGARLTPPDCRDLAEAGVMIELTAHTCSGSPVQFDLVVEAVKLVGAGGIVMSTDYGWNIDLPSPGQGFLNYIDQLWRVGVTEDELRQMTCINPALTLGLD